MLCECVELQAPAAGALWGQLLAALLRMLEDGAGDGAAADRDGDAGDGDDECAPAPLPPRSCSTPHTALCFSAGGVPLLELSRWWPSQLRQTAAYLKPTSSATIQTLCR